MHNLQVGDTCSRAEISSEVVGTGLQWQLALIVSSVAPGPCSPKVTEKQTNKLYLYPTRILYCVDVLEWERKEPSGNVKWEDMRSGKALKGNRIWVICNMTSIMSEHCPKRLKLLTPT